jgi:hypothetical protein
MDDDDFDVLADGVVVGRIMKVTARYRTPLGVGWSGLTPPRHNRK